MTSLLEHILEYHAHNVPKTRKFTGNEIALLRALKDEPTPSIELAKTLGVAKKTVQRIISKLNEQYGGIEIESFGRSASTLCWKSENFDSIYDEI